uniref:Replication enhancer n=1 Tax=Sida golden mosaic virus TaxID=51034 RepID=A0A4P8DXL7_9GEMI|nr:AC3 protein [Sida golden mosaic virus]
MDSRTGELITAHQAENGVYIWEIENPLYFRIYKGRGPLYTERGYTTYKYGSTTYLRRALHLHKALPELPSQTTSTTASGSTYLELGLALGHMYLDQLGVISLNNVIRAVRFATDRAYVNHVLEDHSIKFKFY